MVMLDQAALPPTGGQLLDTVTLKFKIIENSFSILLAILVVMCSKSIDGFSISSDIIS